MWLFNDIYHIITILINIVRLNYINVYIFCEGL